jgi:hypothetical protein
MIRASAVAVAASTQVVFMGRCFATIGDPSSELATGLLTLGFGRRFQLVDATHALNALREFHTPASFEVVH